MATETCCICTDTLENKNRIYLECGHSFHCSCVFQLLSHDDKKCPLCRYEINLQVPESDLQTRLTNEVQKNTELLNDYSTLIYDYRQKLIDFELALVDIATLTAEKLQLDLKLERKEKEIVRYNVEKRRLRERINELEERVAFDTTNEINQKNREIARLKSDLKSEQTKVSKLEHSLFEITEKNIKMAENNEVTLNKMQECIRNLKSSNTEIRVNSRVNRQRFSSSTSSSRMRTRRIELNNRRTRSSINYRS